MFTIQKALDITVRKEYKIFSQNVCHQVPTLALTSSRDWTSQLEFHQSLVTSCVK